MDACEIVVVHSDGKIYSFQLIFGDSGRIRGKSGIGGQVYFVKLASSLLRLLSQTKPCICVLM